LNLKKNILGHVFCPVSLLLEIACDFSLSGAQVYFRIH